MKAGAPSGASERPSTGLAWHLEGVRVRDDRVHERRPRARVRPWRRGRRRRDAGPEPGLPHRESGNEGMKE